MRLPVLTLAVGAVLTLASCGGKTNKPGPGDPAGPPGDPGGGDNVVVTDDTPPADQDVGDPGGDAVGGDTVAGDDSQPVVLTPSTQLCAAGGAVSSASYHGVLCLSPVGSGGPVSSSASYKLIPGPAHIVEAQ